jgi:hypothetical protein
MLFNHFDFESALAWIRSAFWTTPGATMPTRQLVRTLKNFTNGYTSIEVQVRNGTNPDVTERSPIRFRLTPATSRDSWGPSNMEMHEIALLTYNRYGLLSLFFVMVHNGCFLLCLLFWYYVWWFPFDWFT